MPYNSQIYYYNLNSIYNISYKAVTAVEVKPGTGAYQEIVEKKYDIKYIDYSFFDLHKKNIDLFKIINQKIDLNDKRIIQENLNINFWCHDLSTIITHQKIF
jgi:hypothetical protein